MLTRKELIFVTGLIMISHIIKIKGPIMRTFFLILLLFSYVLPNTLIDGMLKIPYYMDEPNMNGEKPPRFKTINKTFLIASEKNDSTIAKNSSPWFKMLYTREAIYIEFGDIVDFISNEAWLDFFIDSDNSNGEQFDSCNDIHFRLNLGLNGTDSIDVAPIETVPTFDHSLVEYSIIKTEPGWQLVIKMPMKILQIEDEYGWEFGFDVQYQSSYSLNYGWSRNNLQTSKNTPNLWGWAFLGSDQLGSNKLSIDYCDENRTVIDGLISPAYIGMSAFDANEFIYFDANEFSNFEDNNFICYGAWNCSYIYFYIIAFDDSIFTNDSYEKSDHFNIFIGVTDSSGNIIPKTINLPVDEYFEHPLLTDYAFTRTKMGWEYEIGIDYSGLGLTLFSVWDFIFDFQKYDNDGAGLESVASWGAQDLCENVPPAEWLMCIETAYRSCGPRCNDDKVGDSDVYQPDFQLYPAYPNPFNSSTKIEYQLQSYANVNIAIYNNCGQLVKTLLKDIYQTGHFSINWDGTNDSQMSLPSGIYFLKTQIQSPQQIESYTSKLLLIN